MDIESYNIKLTLLELEALDRLVIEIGRTSESQREKVSKHFSDTCINFYNLLSDRVKGVDE